MRRKKLNHVTRKVTKVAAVALLCTLFAAESVSATTKGYNDFDRSFSYAPTMPSNTTCTNQTVETYANNVANAYARCTTYTYSGSQPVLTIKSDSSKYPTNSVSYTGADTSGRAMKYTNKIPDEGESVKFRGTVTYNINTSVFTIFAAVRG